MNDTNYHANSTDPHHQWFQYYQQTAATTNQSVIATGGPAGFSEGNSTVVTTSFTANNNTSSLNNSSAASIGSTSDLHVHLSPQGSAGKPIRRRSRASRRTPTTLLNASTTNFRALVQQFTGCQNAKSTTSFGSQKGPVNLSFSKPSMTTTQNDHQTLGTSSRITPLESSYIYDNQQLSQVVHQQQHQQMFENLQINNNSMQSGGVNDYHVIDDMSDFHELVDESSSFCSTENNMGGNYYF